MNAIAPITARPIARPNYAQAETYEAWIKLNAELVHDRWCELQVANGLNPDQCEYADLLAFAKCQFDISSPSSSDGQHGRKSAVCGAQRELSEEGSHAGPGTVGAGTSAIVRYWTVRYRHDGSAIWNYTAVIACDPFKASMVVSNRHRSVTEVVREIDREEYEHLTRRAP